MGPSGGRGQLGAEGLQDKQRCSLEPPEMVA